MMILSVDFLNKKLRFNVTWHAKKKQVKISVIRHNQWLFIPSLIKAAMIFMEHDIISDFKIPLLHPNQLLLVLICRLSRL